jgi:G3E family GTPase
MIDFKTNSWTDAAAPSPLRGNYAFFVLDQPWPGVIRAKGHFWLATRPDWVGVLSVAGVQRRCEPMGFWWATVPKSAWPSHPQFLEQINSHWHDHWGDRRQELVFIGSGMDEAQIRASLDACLIRCENGFDPNGWRSLDDPFPPWNASQPAKHTSASAR